MAMNTWLFALDVIKRNNMYDYSKPFVVCLSAQLNVLLGEDEILEDLRIINKISGKPMGKKPQQPSAGSTPFAGSSSGGGCSGGGSDNLYDARIDDGRLYYEKKW